MTPPLRLRRDVTACDTGTGMVLLDERAGRYWQLNATGARILQSLLDGATPRQVADALSRTYPVSAERAGTDIAGLIDDLTRAKLVTGA